MRDSIEIEERGMTRLSGGDEGTECVTDRLGCDVFTATAVLEKRTLRLSKYRDGIG